MNGNQVFYKAGGKDICGSVNFVFRLNKHAIELKLKECLLAEGAEELKGHSVEALWGQIKTVSYPHYDELLAFIKEIEKIDKNEMALRYGINSKLEPLSENYKFDIDNLIHNTMFLFNVLDEYVVHANIFRKNI